VIRSSLGDDVLRSNGSQEIDINRERLQSDVGLLLQATAGGAYEAALSNYTGDFLKGFHLSGSPEFQLWVEYRRDQLKKLATCLAINLARRAEEIRDPEGALSWWERALALDPFAESTLRRVMTLLAIAGNRGSALARFEESRRRFSHELDAEPSLETSRLARWIADGKLDGTAHWVGDRRRVEVPPGELPYRRRATDLAFI
jgi:DNA-binding SARP family transcriptional activator